MSAIEICVRPDRRGTGLSARMLAAILMPVHCDVAHDHAVYVEPNVWIRHRLQGSYETPPSSRSFRCR